MAVEATLRGRTGFEIGNVRSYFFPGLLQAAVSSNTELSVNNKTSSPVLNYIFGITDENASAKEINLSIDVWKENFDPKRLCSIVDAFIVMGENHNDYAFVCKNKFEKHCGVDHDLFNAVLDETRDLMSMMVRANLEHTENGWLVEFICMWHIAKSDAERTWLLATLYNRGYGWDALVLAKLFNVHSNDLKDVLDAVKKELASKLSTQYAAVSSILIDGPKISFEQNLKRLLQRPINSVVFEALSTLYEELETNVINEDMNRKLENQFVLCSKVRYVLLRTIVENEDFNDDDYDIVLQISFDKFSLFADLERVVFKSALKIAQDVIWIVLRLSGYTHANDSNIVVDAVDEDFIGCAIEKWLKLGIFNADLRNDIRRASVISFIQKLRYALNIYDSTLPIHPNVAKSDQENEEMCQTVTSALKLAQVIVEMNANENSFVYLLKDISQKESFRTILAKLVEVKSSLNSSQVGPNNLHRKLRNCIKDVLNMPSSPEKELGNNKTSNIATAPVVGGRNVTFQVPEIVLPTLSSNSIFNSESEEQVTSNNNDNKNNFTKKMSDPVEIGRGVLVSATDSNTLQNALNVLNYSSESNEALASSQPATQLTQPAPQPTQTVSQSTAQLVTQPSQPVHQRATTSPPSTQRNNIVLEGYSDDGWGGATATKPGPVISAKFVPAISPNENRPNEAVTNGIDFGKTNSFGKPINVASATPAFASNSRANGFGNQSQFGNASRNGW